jgi:hypothetical protein
MVPSVMFAIQTPTHTDGAPHNAQIGRFAEPSGTEARNGSTFAPILLALSSLLLDNALVTYHRAWRKLVARNIALGGPLRTVGAKVPGIADQLFPVFGGHLLASISN